VRKYVAWAKAGIKSTLVYSSDFFLWGLNEFLDTLIFLFIWMIIYGERNSIAGFSLPETVTYLIGVGLISNIISSPIPERIEKDIQEGKLSNFLVKPMSYPCTRLFGSLSGKPLHVLIRIIVYALVAAVFRDKFIINLDATILVLFLISIIFSLIINALLDFCTGFISFWTITTSGFSSLARTLKSIFSGGYAPIVFFPRWFQITAGILPFSYTRYFPMLIYLRKISMMETIRGLGIQILWVAILYLLSRFVWRRGVKRYEGVGI